MIRALRLTEVGKGPRLTGVPRPAPGSGEVAVRIRAAALNFADLLMIEGRYQDTPAPPFTLGLEAAGEVIEAGPGSGLEPGARVAVACRGGAFAEEGVFPAADCLPIPDAMGWDVAAAFQIAYGTSHLALVRRGRLLAGETLVVLGAAGGVGLTAVEIGAALGARVVAVARGDEKRRIAREAGAHDAIDADDDLRARIRDVGGADVIYDAVGGDAHRAAFRALRPEARILVIGFASGDVPQIPANHLLVKNVDVAGIWWGGYAVFAPDAQRQTLAELIDWWEAGRIRPHIGTALPLDRVEEGFAMLRERRATGKIVVRP